MSKANRLNDDAILEYPSMIFSNASTYSDAIRRMNVIGAHIQGKNGVPLQRVPITML